MSFILAVMKWYPVGFKKYVQPRLEEFEIAKDTYPPGIELYDQHYIYFYTPCGKKKA